MAKQKEGLAAVAVETDRAPEATPRPLFEKLKPGPGLLAEQVHADQRRRLHGALIAVVDEAESPRVRVRSVSRAAGVSTSTFYKHFSNIDDCFASTYDAVMSSAFRHAALARRGPSNWSAGVSAAVDSLMRSFAADLPATRLALLQVFGAGPGARKRIGGAAGELERLFAACFGEAPRTVAAPRHLVTAITAGVLRVVRSTTLSGRGDELPLYTTELCDWMLALPAVEALSQLAKPVGPGTIAARREARPFPAEVGSPNLAVGADDRAALLYAVVRLTAAEGFRELTAPRLRAEACVSRRSFEATFESLACCFLEGVETISSEAFRRARSWSERTGGWERQTCQLILALCAQAARDRPRARVAFQEIFATGRTGLLFRERMIDRISAEFRATIPLKSRPSTLMVEASVAAAWHTAHLDIAAGRARNLPTLAPLLSYIVLAPIIGAPQAVAAIRPEIWAEQRC